MTPLLDCLVAATGATDSERKCGFESRLMDCVVLATHSFPLESPLTSLRRFGWLGAALNCVCGDLERPYTSVVRPVAPQGVRHAQVPGLRSDGYSAPGCRRPAGRGGH